MEANFTTPAQELHALEQRLGAPVRGWGCYLMRPEMCKPHEFVGPVDAKVLVDEFSRPTEGLACPGISVACRQ